MSPLWKLVFINIGVFYAEISIISFNDISTQWQMYISKSISCELFSWNVKIDNELLRRQFAEKANVVGPWIERQLDAVTAIGLGLQVINVICIM